MWWVNKFLLQALAPSWRLPFSPAGPRGVVQGGCWEKFASIFYSRGSFYCLYMILGIRGEISKNIITGLNRRHFTFLYLSLAFFPTKGLSQGFVFGPLYRPLSSGYSWIILFPQHLLMGKINIGAQVHKIHFLNSWPCIIFFLQSVILLFIVFSQ